MQRILKAGHAADAGLIFHIFAMDSASVAGAGKASVAYSSFSCRYIRAGGAISGAITPEDITTIGTYAAPTANTNIRIKAVDNTNMIGVYELQLHLDWVSAGSEALTIFLTATGVAPIVLTIPLIATNPQDAVRGGMTALPNAAADAAGGLPISDAGGLDLDAKVGALTFTVAGKVDANATHISGSAVAADNAEIVYATDFAANYDGVQTRWIVEIGAGGISASSFGAGAIDAAAIAAGAITATSIAAGAFSSAKFGTAFITSSSFASSAISNTVIATGALTSAKFGADAITASVLAADAATEIGAACVVAMGTGTFLSAIPDLLLDEPRSGHATQGTVGESFSAMVSGTAAGVPTTTVIGTNLTEATNDHYKSRALIFIGGVCAQQARPITGYNGTTKELTTDAFTDAPTAGDPFIIV